eukprot:augustus_masked-scaffold_22-processed-gene-4.3-mRNA-1 protein AED:1.00 eAED:1.00 QI:0/0/0/0/1/1/2/0/501
MVIRGTRVTSIRQECELAEYEDVQDCRSELIDAIIEIIKGLSDEEIDQFNEIIDNDELSLEQKAEELTGLLGEPGLCTPEFLEVLPRQVFCKLDCEEGFCEANEVEVAEALTETAGQFGCELILDNVCEVFDEVTDVDNKCIAEYGNTVECFAPYQEALEDMFSHVPISKVGEVTDILTNNSLSREEKYEKFTAAMGEPGFCTKDFLAVVPLIVFCQEYCGDRSCKANEDILRENVSTAAAGFGCELELNDVCQVFHDINTGEVDTDDNEKHRGIRSSIQLEHTNRVPKQIKRKDLSTQIHQSKELFDLKLREKIQQICDRREVNHDIPSEARSEVIEELVPEERVRFFHRPSTPETLELLRQKRLNWRTAIAEENARMNRKVATTAMKDRQNWVKEHVTAIQKNFDIINTRETKRMIKKFRKRKDNNTKLSKDANGNGIQVKKRLKIFQKHTENTQRYVAPEAGDISREVMESYHITRENSTSKSTPRKDTQSIQLKMKS